MKLSKVHEQQYLSACRQGKIYKECNCLFVKWQKQLKHEGKFHTLGKPVVVIA